jgi:pimeloyl-ACP methyl ester carboxylesterase
MRGHGRSDRPAPPYHWRRFGEDVAAVTGELGLQDATGVGHSKGGHATTVATALRPGAFGRLLLIDPVILPREAYGRSRIGGDHFAARRRNNWTSPEEMFERFKDRPPFSGWEPAVLRDYCEYGLLPSPSGHGYELACPPAIEAAVYAGSASDDPYDEIARIDVPVRVLRARSRGGPVAADMSSSPTAPDLASHFQHGEDVFLPDHSHFIPMEDPALVALHILEIERIPGRREGT